MASLTAPPVPLAAAPRTSFARGTPGETALTRRARYEAWVLQSGPTGNLDYEWRTVRLMRDRGLAKDAPTRVPRALCIKARCLECESAGDDPGAYERIATCGVKVCALWSVRPFQGRRTLPDSDPADETDGGDAGESAKHSRKNAVRRYCIDCTHGPGHQKATAEVVSCPSVTCALWPVRPGAATQAETPVNPF